MCDPSNNVGVDLHDDKLVIMSGCIQILKSPFSSATYPVIQTQSDINTILL